MRKTLLPIDFCDLCGLDLLKGDMLPKALFMHVSLPHHVLGKPGWIRMMLLVLDILDLLSSPSLPKRATHWPHLGDIKEPKQLQEESATNYASETAVKAEAALFRRWVWNSVWLWLATLTQLCIHGGEWRIPVVWKDLALCRG